MNKFQFSARTLSFFFSDNFGQRPRKALCSAQGCQIKKQNSLNRPVGQKYRETHDLLACNKLSHANRN